MLYSFRYFTSSLSHMTDFEIVPASGQHHVERPPSVPALFLDAGENAWRRVIEFFTAHIRNPNTRAAYMQAVRQFSRWCGNHGLRLHQVTPFIVASYIEETQDRLSIPSVKQHLAAIPSISSTRWRWIRSPALSARSRKSAT